MTILFSALLEGSGTCSHMAATRLDARWHCRSWYASRIMTGSFRDSFLPSSTLVRAMDGLREWSSGTECLVCWDRSEALLLGRFLPGKKIFCLNSLPQSEALPLLYERSAQLGLPHYSGQSAMGNLDLMLCLLRFRFERVPDFRKHAEKIA